MERALRRAAVLRAIVETYVETAEPVSSRAVLERAGLSVSSATVRAVMGELESLGLLAQPHTSAGRIPTDRAFRAYVDDLLDASLAARDPSDPRARGADAAALASLDLQGAAPVGTLVQRAADLLSRATGQLGFFAGGLPEPGRLVGLRAVRVAHERVLVLLAYRTGAVQSCVLEESESDSRALDRVSQQLSALVDGLTLGEARARLEHEIAEERARRDAHWQRGLALGRAGVERVASHARAEFFVGERNLLLSHPEFADVGRVRDLFAALEEKERMLALVDRVMRSRRLCVVIGAELDDPELRDLAVVSAPLGDSASGGIGVIGPVRMPYERVISTVRALSDQLGAYLG